MLKKLFNSYYQGPSTKHFDGQRFFNAHGPNRLHCLKDVLRWHFQRPKNNWPLSVPNLYDDRPPTTITGQEIRISFIGHVTLLFQTQGLNILTDPVWSKRVSPFSFIGPCRIHQPGISFEHLPPIDVIWISHNHYDHMDIATLKKIWKRDRPRIITPLGNDTILKRAGINAEAYDLEHSVPLNSKVTLHLEPMLHWSARGLFDKNKALWAAMVLETPTGYLYFVGDSGYSPYFRQAQEKYKQFKAAFLPIGAYEPRWFMQHVHMNPFEALQAQEDLGAPLMIPTHYDVFPLADEGYKQALSQLLEGHQNAPHLPLKILEIGEHFYLQP